MEDEEWTHWGINRPKTMRTHPERGNKEWERWSGGQSQMDVLHGPQGTRH